MDILITKPFRTSIAKISILGKIISSMNHYVKDIVRDKKKSKDLDYDSATLR